VPLRRNGVASHGVAFAEQMRFTIAPPGRVPVYNRLFSLVDVPDLRVLAELWPEVDSVWMGAAPVPEILHRALIVCAHLVRLGLVRSLSPLAPLMHYATNIVRWGEQRGGMFVTVRGRDAAGGTVARSWHLVAEGDDGPMIPAMAVEAVVRALVDGHTPQPGARAAIRDVELSDYERLFARRRIHTGTRDDAVPGPLYERLLGAAVRDLPWQIRDMHDLRSGLVAHGTADVERGGGFIARLVAALMGFPVTANQTPVTVRFTVADGVETWARSFGDRTFSSAQLAGQRRNAHLLCERFGPLTFAMALAVEGGHLSLVLRRWSVLGIPLPIWLCPRAHAYESVKNGRFCFHVEIRHALTGLIIRYEGSLASPEPRGD
jgi:hypothetical protein